MLLLEISMFTEMADKDELRKAYEAVYKMFNSIGIKFVMHPHAMDDRLLGRDAAITAEQMIDTFQRAMARSPKRFKQIKNRDYIKFVIRDSSNNGNYVIAVRNNKALLITVMYKANYKLDNDKETSFTIDL